MKRKAKLSLAAAAALSVMGAYSGNAFGQISLSGTSYTENFNNLATGLPTGVTISTQATATTLGPAATFTMAATPWNATGGGWSNDASYLTGSSATVAQQAAATDRILSMRQTGTANTGGDPGASVAFTVANTTGFQGFTLNMDLEQLDSQGRTVVWTIDYRLGNSGAFSTLGTYTDTNAFGNTPFSMALPSGVDNQGNDLVIRVSALGGSTGSGSRPRFGVDNFNLTYTGSSLVPRNLVWDSNSGTAGIQEGSGTWSTSASNTVWQDPTNANVAWRSLPADNATFGSASGTGSPGTVNLGEAISVGSMTFNKSGYNITDTSNFGLTIGGNVTVNGASTDSATISGNIGGTNGLIKAGAGLLLLTGTNTYSNGTTVNGGTVSVASDSNLGNTAGGIVLNGGTLFVSTNGTFSTTRGITVGTSGGTISLAGGASFGGAITATTGALTIAGGGSFLLTGIAGGAAAPVPIIVTGGNVGLASTGVNAQNFSSPGPNLLNGDLVIATPLRVNFDGGTFSGSGTIQTQVSDASLSASGSLANLNVVVNNNINLNSLNVAGPFITHLGAATATNTLTLNGLISGNSDIDFSSDNSTVSGTGTGNGAGVLVLGSANTWTGSTTVDNAATGGVVRLGVNNALPTGTALQFGGTSTAYSVGAVDLNGHNQTVGSLASGTTNTIIGIVNTGASLSTLTISGSAATTYSGNIGIPSNLTNLTGANNNIALVLGAGNTGSLVLSGANAYSGGTTVSGGTLIAANVGGSATGTGSVQVNSGGSIAGNGNIGGSVTVASGGNVSPGIGGVGTLHMGSLSLASGTSLHYDLNTPSASDKMVFTNSGSNATVNGGTFTFNGNVANPGTFPLFEYAGTLGGAGFLALSISTPSLIGFKVTLEQDTTNKIINAVVLSNAPGVTWNGNLSAGSWDKTTSNWHGLTATYADGNQVLFDDTATNKNVVVNDTVGPQAITFQNNTDYTLSQGSGDITDNGNIGPSDFVKRGSGKLTITGNYSFTGPVAVDEGTVSVATIGVGGNAGPLGAGSEIRIGAGTLAYTGAPDATDRTISISTTHATVDIALGSDFTFAGVVAGSGGLNKAGLGVLSLQATNTYAGPTHVVAGTLAVGSGSNVIPDTSDVTIDASAHFSLGGNGENVGSIAGAGTIDVNSGTTLGVGGSNTSATFSGNITAGNLNKTGTGTQTLSGTNTIDGQITVTGGTLAITSAGALGSTANIILDTGGTLATYNTISTDRTVNIGAAGGTIDTEGNLTLTTPMVNAAAGSSLTKTGPGTLTLPSPASIFNKPINVVAGTLQITNVDSNGIGGNGTAAMTVSNTGVLQVAGVTLGVKNDGTPGSAIVLNLNNGGTLMGTGAAMFAGSTAPVVGVGATVNLETGTSSTDVLAVASSMRSASNGDTTPKIIVNDQTSGNGKGTVQLVSGAVSAATAYSGSWEVRGGILQIGPDVTGSLVASTGEPLNALGYNPTDGASGPTRPVTVTAGVLAVGVAAHNPNAIPAAPDTFRSPVTLAGGAMASTAGITAPYAGDIATTAGTTSKILAYDPQSPSTVANVNFVSQATVAGNAAVPGNFNWGANSTVIVDPGSTTGGVVDFNRTATGDTVTVGSNATLQINSGAIVQFDNTQDSLSDGTHFVNVVNNSTTGSNGGLNVASTTAAKNIGVLSGTGSTTVQSGASLIASGITQNALTLHGNAQVRAGSASVSRIPQSGLTIDSGKQLDLTNNKLIVSNGTLGTLSGTTYSGVTGMVQAGRNGGAWNGTGIVTSQTQAKSPANPLTTLAVASNADLHKLTFGGQSVSSTDVLVMYTYAGDANLDGKIDADDYFQIDSNYNKSGSSTSSYFKGDFNYDGKINGDDYFIIDSNYAHQTLGVFPASLPAGDGGLSGVAAVPEPASLGLLVLATAGLFGRRKRRQAAQAN